MRNYYFLFCLLLLSVALIFSCSNHTTNSNPLFELAENTGIDFNNKVVDDSLENAFLFRNFYNGNGVAIGDINNDGLADVFMSSNTGNNKLYLNKGDFKFEDITQKAGINTNGWMSGTTMADVNNDGWLDIYICRSGPSKNPDRKSVV